MYKKKGTPGHTSRWICLHCIQENMVGVGIQRGQREREKYHIKDLTCINPGCNGTVTKNMEVRCCDFYDEIYAKAVETREKYYSDYPDEAMTINIGEVIQLVKDDIRVSWMNRGDGVYGVYDKKNSYDDVNRLRAKIEKCENDKWNIIDDIQTNVSSSASFDFLHNTLKIIMDYYYPLLHNTYSLEDLGCVIEYMSDDKEMQGLYSIACRIKYIPKIDLPDIV